MSTHLSSLSVWTTAEKLYSNNSYILSMGYDGLMQCLFTYIHIYTPLHNDYSFD